MRLPFSYTPLGLLLCVASIAGCQGGSSPAGEYWATIEFTNMAELLERAKDNPDALASLQELGAKKAYLILHASGKLEFRQEGPQGTKVISGLWKSDGNAIRFELTFANMNGGGSEVRDEDGVIKAILDSISGEKELIGTPDGDNIFLEDEPGPNLFRIRLTRVR